LNILLLMNLIAKPSNACCKLYSNHKYTHTQKLIFTHINTTFHTSTHIPSHTHTNIHKHIDIPMPRKKTHPIHRYPNLARACERAHAHTHTPEATVYQCTESGSQDLISSPASYTDKHMYKGICKKTDMNISMILIKIKMHIDLHMYEYI